MCWTAYTPLFTVLKGATPRDQEDCLYKVARKDDFIIVSEGANMLFLLTLCIKILQFTFISSPQHERVCDMFDIMSI